MLNQTASRADVSFFSEAGIRVSQDHPTSYHNFCFNLCYAIETVYLRPDRLSSVGFYQPRRWKEHAFESKGNIKVN